MEEEIKTAKTEEEDVTVLKKNIERKYSKLVYWAQTASMIVIALAFPQSILNREYVLSALILISALLMLIPMFYIGVVREQVKKEKDTEEET